MTDAAKAEEVKDAIRSLCYQNSRDQASMFGAVCEELVLPKIRELGREGYLHQIRVDGVDPRIIKVWNSLMPDFQESDDWLERSSKTTWQWISLTDLFSEQIEINAPQVMEDERRVHLLGFRDDNSMRDRAAEAIVQAVMPFLMEGSIPPVMARCTMCDTTREFIKFGLVQFKPVVLDMNDNELDVIRVTNDEGPSPE